MTFSVVDFNASGISATSGSGAKTVSFSYSGLSPGDIIVFASAAWQGAASWTINGNTLGSVGSTWDTGLKTNSSHQGRAYALQTFSEPSTGTIVATLSGDAVGGVAYWIVHDSEGFFGSTSDFHGIDLDTPGIFGYQSNTGPRSGSDTMTAGSHAAGYPSIEEVQFAVAGVWTYRTAGGGVNNSTMSSPTGMTSTQAGVTPSSYPEYAAGMGAYEIASGGTVPSRTSTITWSVPTAPAPFPDSIGVNGTIATPTIYISQRKHVTLHKTIQPNGDGYDGPAATTDFTVEIFDNRPSGFPDLGPFALAISVDGDDMRLPDNDYYQNGSAGDNAGADWGGVEFGVTDYDVTNVVGDGGNITVTWTSGNSFTVQVNGDGDLYIENTYTGTTPVTGADHWGILSGDP